MDFHHYHPFLFLKVVNSSDSTSLSESEFQLDHAFEPVATSSEYISMIRILNLLEAHLLFE